ncbi:hypothetical protein ACIPRI_25100 [Variovorax sp. LARHSF232]
MNRGADDDKMIQTPTPHNALAKIKAAMKSKAKAGIRVAARLVVKSPALKKFLIQTIKRFPALDRRVRATVNPFDALAVRRTSAPGDLSPAAQAVLRRLQPNAQRKT